MTKRSMRLSGAMAVRVGIGMISLALFFSFNAGVRPGVPAALAAPSESAYSSEDEYRFYINQDTVWKKGDDLTFDKPVQIDSYDTATKLTVEAGAEVHLNGGDLLVQQGIIIAQGTKDEPITFTSDENKPFSIIFQGYPDDGQTILSHIRIQGGGSYSDPDDCNYQVRSWWEPLIHTAYAGDCPSGTAVIQYRRGQVRIEDAKFVGNKYADIEVEMYLESSQSPKNFLVVKHSSLADNEQHIALKSTVYCSVDYTPIGCGYGVNEAVSLEDNWYGTDTKTDGVNNDGISKNDVVFGTTQLNGTFDLQGWLHQDPFPTVAACTKDCFSNVLFLPGLEASRLYAPGAAGTENQLWEPNRDADGEKLFLDKDGKSVRDDIYTRDVINEKNVLPVGQENIYKSFLSDLTQWKTDNLIADYAVVPYDWRLSFADILAGGVQDGDNISYTKPASSSYIIDELRRLAATSKSGKVMVVAHSNGGLLTKALVQKLGDVEAQKLIDTIVFVAVPQSGTTQTIGALLQGFEQGLPLDVSPVILTPQTARRLADNMPGAYQLLPSDAYFTGSGSGVTTPVISFDDGASTKVFTDKYGFEIRDHATLKSFLKDDEGKLNPDSNNLFSPIKLNNDLLSAAADAHQSLDNWTAPAGISVYQIAGTGEKTVSTIHYWTDTMCTMYVLGFCTRHTPYLTYTPELVTDGDGTVVTPSALAMGTDRANVKRYWVDLKGYNDAQHGINMDRNHASILEVQQLREFIKTDILVKSSTVLPDFIADSAPSTNTDKQLQFYLHSPLSLAVQDNEEHEISATTSTIPGATYRRFGEVQYVSVPAAIHPKLVLNGEAEGSFTLEVQETTGDTVTAKTTFSAIPTTDKTKVTMDFPDGTIEHASPLAVDMQGSGTPDLILPPQVGGTVLAEDILAPTTIPTVTGTQGKNGWYMSDVTVTLTATDNANGSGIEKTEYSLDNGAYWNAYTQSIVLTQEGITKIQYRSIDKVKNTEETKVLEIKIDKTAPEAKFVFNPTTQQLDITGQDNLSPQTTVTMTDTLVSDKIEEERGARGFFDWFFHRKPAPKQEKFTIAILTDEAGHTTKITFKKEKDKDRRIDITLRSIAYDGVVTNWKDTSLQYKWNIQKKTGKYMVFAAEAQTQNEQVESHYVAWRDMTYLMTRPQALDDDENDSHFEFRPTRQAVKGMAILRLETKQGKVSVVY